MVSEAATAVCRSWEMLTTVFPSSFAFFVNVGFRLVKEKVIGIGGDGARKQYALKLAS